MKTVTIQEVESYQVVNEGSEGIIYLYDENRLMKIYKKPSKHILENVVKLHQKQKTVLCTEFPLEIVLGTKGNFIGILIPFYQNSISMEDMFTGDIKFEITYYIYILLHNLEEFVENNIYIQDLYTGNVLIDVEEEKIHLIDTEGEDTYSGEDQGHLEILLRQVTGLIIDLLGERDLEKRLQYQDDISYYRENKVLPEFLLTILEKEGYTFIFAKLLLSYYTWAPSAINEMGPTQIKKKNLQRHL